jgi:hypothetical protein
LPRLDAVSGIYVPLDDLAGHTEAQRAFDTRRDDARIGDGAARRRCRNDHRLDRTGGCFSNLRLPAGRKPQGQQQKGGREREAAICRKSFPAFAFQAHSFRSPFHVTASTLIE